MLDKEQINKNKEEAIQKLCILMMICDRDIHDKEYEKVIDVIEKHSMYEISFDQISVLVSEVAFEREQKSANWMMLNFVDTLHKLFLNSSSVIENMRGHGMRLFNRNIFLKRYAMKNALGIDL